MSEGFNLQFDKKKIDELAKLPYVVSKNAFDRFLTNVVLAAHRRAIKTKKGKKRTWLTPSQRGKGEPRGSTSPKGFIPVDTGRLRTSVRFKVATNFRSIGGAGRVFSNLNYSPAMEARRGFFKAAKLTAEIAVDEIFDDAVIRAKKKFGLENL
tara:strand:+ start:4172 stop:4630 length:459 start_codon:yes stop_codon:yes gene_type:complete